MVCLGGEGPLAPSVREVGARVLALGLPRRAGTALARLALTIRRERPQVVYAFLFWGYGLALPMSKLVAPSALRVAARRSLPDTDLPGRKWTVPLRRVADRCSHAIIANSDAVAAAWAGCGAPRDRLHVVSNGVELPASGSRPEHGGLPLTVICVGNLIAYKGHDLLLEAAARLPSEPAWRLLFVGDGPERDALSRRVDELGLRHRVDLLGQRTDVPALLSDADVAVLPSRSEGLPNAVLEAMAHSIPVVATAVGGVPGLLRAGGGILVPANDASALADALARLLRDPDLRRQMGDEGRAEVARTYAIDVMRDSTLAIMRTVRAERVRARRSRP